MKSIIFILCFVFSQIVFAQSQNNGGVGNASLIQGIPVTSTTPTAGQGLVFNGTTMFWNPGTVGGGGGGTVTSIKAATGLTGGTITSSGTISVDVGTAANKIVQLTTGAQYPAADGNLITNVNASFLSGVALSSVSPINGQILTYNSTLGQWKAAASSGGSTPSDFNFTNSYTSFFNNTNDPVLMATTSTNGSVSFGSADITASSGASTISVYFNSGSITNSGSTGVAGSVNLSVGENAGTGAPGNLNVTAGNINNASSSQNAGALFLSGGTTNGSGLGGDITATAGSANSSTGGNIILSPGSGTPNGAIKLNDQSGTITAGKVWTATASDGSGHWASGGSSNATSIQGIAVASTSPTSAQVLTYNSTLSQWNPQAAGGGGVTTVGAFSGSSQTNGATISGSTITFGPADATNPGMVSTGTQTIAGAKTLNGQITINGSAGGSAGIAQLEVDTTASTGQVNVATFSSAGNTAILLKNTGGGSNGLFIGNSGGASADWQFVNNDNGQIIFYSSGAKLVATSTDLQLKTATSCAGIQTSSTGAVSCTSDERLKDIQRTFKPGLSALASVKPIVYKWNDKYFEMHHEENIAPKLKNELYTGFSAQNVMKTIPESVKIGEDGYYKFQEMAVIATLVNAVNELSEKAKRLEAKIQRLEDAKPKPKVK